jgi:hypothetical protein
VRKRFNIGGICYLNFVLIRWSCVLWDIPRSRARTQILRAELKKEHLLERRNHQWFYATTQKISAERVSGATQLNGSLRTPAF